MFKRQANFVRFVEVPHIDRILQTVKNIILQWSLDLEKEGVLGEGLSFNPEEKDRASHISINIGTISGNFTSRIDNRLTQDVVINFNKNDLVGLEETLKKIDIHHEQIIKLKKAFDQDGETKNKDKLGKYVLGWISSLSKQMVNAVAVELAVKAVS